jgi:hypothetical protein
MGSGEKAESAGFKEFLILGRLYLQEEYQCSKRNNPR